MGMRPEGVAENAELGPDWKPKKAAGFARDVLDSLEDKFWPRVAQARPLAASLGSIFWTVLPLFILRLLVAGAMVFFAVKSFGGSLGALNCAAWLAATVLFFRWFRSVILGKIEREGRKRNVSVIRRNP